MKPAVLLFALLALLPATAPAASPLATLTPFNATY